MAGRLHVRCLLGGRTREVRVEGVGYSRQVDYPNILLPALDGPYVGWWSRT